MIKTSGGEKPTGLYADEMTGPGAWPETDESVFTDRATQLGEKLTGLGCAVETFGSHKASIFNGIHVWSGAGANAAGTKVGAHATAMEGHQQQLRDAIGWCNEAAGHIATAKDIITANVKAGLKEINTALGAASESDQDPTAAIDAIVKRKYGENVRILKDLAVGLDGKLRVPAAPPAEPGAPGTEGEPSGKPEPDSMSLYTKDSRDGTGPGYAPLPEAEAGADPLLDAGKDSRDGTGPGYAPLPEAEAGADPLLGAGKDSRDGTGSGYQSTPAPVVPQGPAGRPGMPSVPSGGTPAPSPSTGGGPGLPSLGGGPGTSSAPSTTAPSPLSNLSSPASTQAAAAAGGPQTGAVPQTPAQAFAQSFNEAANAGPQVQPASAVHAPTPAPPAQETLAFSSASSGAAGGGAASGPAPGSPAVPVNSGTMSGGPAMPPPMPLGPPATPAPAAPTVPVAPAGPVPASASPSAASVVGAAPVPVSAARAEREAIAAASAAGALRRKSKGNDPSQVARRIAAALNADQSVDFGFYWMTGLAADGTIVVANTYGIGYIPEGVNLPEQVKMASADESIPAVERGRWATYPVLTLQGWAQQHGTALRQIIATEAQFQGFDPGAAKVILQPDDIPDNGHMAGRSRLEVLAPDAAAKLASVGDAGLTELLPAAPTDVNPPADETFNKWFEVMKPMMSTSTDRGLAHLRAFIDYADHAQEKALFVAHTALDASAQRAAITDWVYWQHLSVLMSDASSGLKPS